MAKASLEILSGIIRIGADDHIFGDPYVVSVTFIVDEDTVIFKGLDKKITLEQAKAIRDVFKKYKLYKWKIHRHEA
jgi:hypothetical protein